MKIKVSDIVKAVKGTLLFGNGELCVEGVTTSSKDVTCNDLFVPVIGERVDAHKFIADAFNSGASCSFTSEGAVCNGNNEHALIEVDDTVSAMQRLGAWYRDRKVNMPLVAVTGSVGKTTTREMISLALSAGLKVYSTKGNQNSQIGVPATVMRTDENADIAVVEVGISMPGEMKKLAPVVKPDMAVFTIIGISHIENLRTQENIMIEKLHIIDEVKDNGMLLLNADDKLLSKVDRDKLNDYGIAEGKKLDIFYYGTSEKADVKVENITEENGYPVFDILLQPKFTGKDVSVRRTVKLGVLGLHMVLDSAAAIAVSYRAGVDIDKAIEALNTYKPFSGRGSILENNGIMLIDDGYNAAPQSMKAGLKVLNDFKNNGKRIAVLADMKELGASENEYHKEIGGYIGKTAVNIDTVLLYGPLSLNIERGIEDVNGKQKIKRFDDSDGIKSFLKANLKKGDVVYFKGSNCMGLSKLANDLSGELDEIR